MSVVTSRYNGLILSGSGIREAFMPFSSLKVYSNFDIGVSSSFCAMAINNLENRCSDGVSGKFYPVFGLQGTC